MSLLASGSLDLAVVVPAPRDLVSGNNRAATFLVENVTPPPSLSSQRQHVTAILHEYTIGGVLVSWPIQTDTGRCGASCGRVMYALDQLALETPICLWAATSSSTTSAAKQVTTKDEHDVFGREEAYAKAASETMKRHVASKEQYCAQRNVRAVDLWKDFCKTQWPKRYATNNQNNCSYQKEKQGLA
jgi:hypothetical protein